jgi:hypothetical protein
MALAPHLIKLFGDTAFVTVDGTPTT